MLLASLAFAADLTIPYERFTLDNGLDVVLHQDRSDPIVAVATLVHVGSSREVPGRTGFAHFFEHMAFNDSENVPRGANRKRIEEWGGRRNGGTNRDHTIYYEVVPSDSLERILWIDSDRLGFMINTVTEAALENEKQVVKNEKRQNYDNRPYGHTWEVVSRALYGERHPYGWTTIGSLEDLQAATLEDVRTFYDTWYGPNNAVLVLAGDFELEPTRALIEKWFGEIPRGKEVFDPEPRPAPLRETVSLHHLDAFAKQPDLRLVFPGVPRFHEDSYALDALTEILTDGKNAPLYRELVEERRIATDVYAWSGNGELAGEITVGVRVNPDVDLDVALEGVQAAMATFAEQGFDPAELERSKAGQERSFYDGIQSVLDKAFALARYTTYADDPGYLTTDLAKLKAVTPDDVMRVFATYLQDAPHVRTSFVPEATPELALDGSQPAEVAIEQVVKGAEAPPAQVVAGDYERTPTSFDRSREPDLGPPSEVAPPRVVHGELDGGLGVYSIQADELPLAQFAITISGGLRTDAPGQAGLHSLLAELLLEGTANRTPAELEAAVKQLGADLSIEGGRDAITLRGSCLARQFDATFDLAVEALTEPRFDPDELTRLKSERLTYIGTRAGNARQLGRIALNRAIYGDEHPYGWPIEGTADTIAGLELKDLKKAHKKGFSTAVTDVSVVGAVDRSTVEAAAARLGAAMRSKPVKARAWDPVPPADAPRLVFVDVPGSKQSVIYAGQVAMPRGDEAFFDLDVAHRRLGGGSSGQLFQTLRIDKGYTYGAYSFAAGRELQGLFGISTSVRANVTRESLEIARQLVTDYAGGFDADELGITKTIVGKRKAVEFETLDARLDHLVTLAIHDLPPDQLRANQTRLEGVGVDDVKATVAKWMDPQRLVWVVVGDGETQRSELEQLGLPITDLDAAALNAMR